MLLETNRLHRHLGEPEWTPAQWHVAADTLAGAEADLAAALYGTVIEPQERHEYALVDTGGAVDLELPIFALVAVDGTIAPDGHPPAGWTLQDRRLRRDASGWAGTVATTGLAPQAAQPRGYRGQVHVHYLGGWGADPALTAAILRKAGDRMADRHSDSMRISGVNAAPEGPVVRWEWTEQELAPLARFRNLSVGYR